MKRNHIFLLGASIICAVVVMIAIVFVPAGSDDVGAAPDTAEIRHPDHCKTGADANRYIDCEVVAVANSLDTYWAEVFAQNNLPFQQPIIVLYNKATETGCGAGSSAIGPFYCRLDQKIYLDLSFMAELENRFGAQGGFLARAYVIAHEYGHHVQKQVGISISTSESGPTSGAVRKELQADCYAGIWTNHTASTPFKGKQLITQPNRDDIAAVIDTAERLGDDFVQQRVLDGPINPAAYRHGTSSQRAKWYNLGLNTGNPAMCDTYARGVDLG